MPFKVLIREVERLNGLWDMAELRGMIRIIIPGFSWIDKG